MLKLKTYIQCTQVSHFCRAAFTGSVPLHNYPRTVWFLRTSGNGRLFEGFNNKKELRQKHESHCFGKAAPENEDKIRQRDFLPFN